MEKLTPGWLLLNVASLALLLNVIAAPADGASPAVPPKCDKQAREKQNVELGFFPRAIALTQMNVRRQLPEYSFLQGKWRLGEFVETLPPETCLAILDKQTVGVIQIWYLVQYRTDPKAPLRTGWVWGGAVNVDENQYIGGDKTPLSRSSGATGASAATAWGFFPSVAYAQADPSPIGPGSGPAQEGTGQEYYVEIVPFFGGSVRSATASVVALFVAMVGGMLAKASWDETDRGKIRPSMVKIVRPILISPIAFSAFWGALQIQTGNTGFSLTAALYAFQIGFMWQHVLEKKISGE